MGQSSRTTSYIAGNDVMIIVSAIVVTLRLYIRLKHSQRGIWLDDIFMFISLLVAIAFGALVNISMDDYGWGQHIWTIPLESLSKTYQMYIIAKVLFVLASTFIRMSLLFFYFSLVRDLGSRTLRRTILGCVVANALLGIICSLLSIFQCSPVRAIWLSPRPESAKCLDDGMVTSILGGFLCLADLVVNILPFPIVAMLKIPLRRRISIGILLSLGTIATIAGVVREYFIYRVLVQAVDVTWEALPLWICADVEIYVALLCACAPALKPLYTKIQDRFSALVDRNMPFHELSAQSDQPKLSPRDIDPWDVFDGACLSNVTHICADREHDSVYDRARATVMRKALIRNNPSTIQVVTHIHLDSVDPKPP